MSDWIDETLDEAEQIALEAGGVRVARSLVPWNSILGALALPAEAPTQLYLLVPRRPPAPPWFVLKAKELDAESRELGLPALAERIAQRARQGTYREAMGHRPTLSAQQLLERVLAREELPGALDVPVGAGPGRGFDRFLSSAVAGAAGTTTAFFGGAVLAPPLAPVLAGVGLAVGAATPFAWRALQRRARQKPRVLVLAPDGCVVGFPTGVRAFVWRDIDRFQATEAPLPGRRRPIFPQLEIVLRDDLGKGRIAASWFDAPLPLIITVAEAYRLRQIRNL